MDVLINNERYINIKELPAHNATIGIGVTTHNRNKLVAETVAKIQAATPGARVVVVDDASQTPVKIKGVEVYRFNENVGIARAKNKCLELLSDCDHIFLFDDDTWPLVPGWHIPYVASPEHHLMYLFEKWANGRPVGDDKVIYQDENIVAHHHARGCMLYIDKLALATVGGMDTRYGKAMNEHLDWSMRIHNAGLTTFMHMDVPNSEQLIYSSDQHQAVASSIKYEDRVANLNKNNALLEAAANSSEYAPYGKDIVIACYFTGVIDPQRNKRWAANMQQIEILKRSVEAKGIEFVLIHDCFDLPNRVTISSSPYFERWLKEWQYLRDRRDINNVFLVDATDVDMLNNPFGRIKPDRLYIGDEPGLTLNCNWMVTRHREPTVNKYLYEYGDLPLLNCGVVGGERKLVMALCQDMYKYHLQNPQDTTEMGIFNMLMHTKYAEQADYGRHVTTLFKRYEVTSNAWFRHK